MRVHVEPHNPEWCRRFDTESRMVRGALGANVVGLEHIGSTAVPNICAKPIIDLLVEVADLAAVDRDAPALEMLGYEAMGAYGIPGRRYFRRAGAGGVRRTHVHTFATGSPHLERHRAFRDFLIAHPDWAQRYADLKTQLAAAHPNDSDAYVAGKHDFIQAIDRRAAAWRTASGAESPR